MNIEDAENLERLNKKLQLIRDRVASVALGYNTGFFLYGAGGSGKSFAVREELESLETKWTLHNSAMSAAGLYDMLHDLHDHVHVFEDMEQLYTDKTAVGYLRSATWGDSNMQNRVVTRTKFKQRDSFKFLGGIIILSNLPLGEISTLKALATRLNPAEFNPTEGEKRSLMLKIAEGGKFDLQSDSCEEVCEYLIYYANLAGKPLDLRLLDNALKDRLMYDRGDCRTHWKDLVASRIDAQIIEPRLKPRTRSERILDERSIAKEVYDKFPDSRESRSKEWQDRTGKSERALYRRAGELGLDATPKYLSLDDIEDFAAETVKLSIDTL